MKKILTFALSIILAGTALVGCGEVVINEELAIALYQASNSAISELKEEGFDVEGEFWLDSNKNISDTSKEFGQNFYDKISEKEDVGSCGWIVYCKDECVKEAYISYNFENEFIRSYGSDIYDDFNTLDEIRNQMSFDIKLNKANSNAKKVCNIFSDYSEKYMPDSLNGEAIYSNIEEKYNSPVLEKITKELSEEIGGYWVIIVDIEQSSYDGPYISPYLTTDVYWAESLEDIYVGSNNLSSEYNSDTNSFDHIYGETETSSDGLKGYLHEYDTNFITSSQWYEKYGEEWDKTYSEKLESRRKELSEKRFTEDRKLKDITHSRDAVIDKDKFKSYENDSFSVSGLNVEIKDGKINFDGTMKNKTDYRKNIMMHISVYNAAGEEKDKFKCDIGELAGGDSYEFGFTATPNCIDQLYYYQLTLIYTY